MEYIFDVHKIAFNIRSNRGTKAIIEFKKFFSFVAPVYIIVYIEGTIEGSPKDLDMIGCDMDIANSVVNSIGDKLINHMSFLEKTGGLNSFFQGCKNSIIKVLEQQPLDYTDPKSLQFRELHAGGFVLATNKKEAHF